MIWQEGKKGKRDSYKKLGNKVVVEKLYQRMKFMAIPLQNGSASLEI